MQLDSYTQLDASDVNCHICHIVGRNMAFIKYALIKWREVAKAS